jgi:hypothetical protein
LGGWSGRIERRTGKQVDASKEKWKPDMKAIKAVIQFVKAAERLQWQVVPRVEEKDEESGGGEMEVED